MFACASTPAAYLNSSVTIGSFIEPPSSAYGWRITAAAPPTRSGAATASASRSPRRVSIISRCCSGRADIAGEQGRTEREGEERRANGAEARERSGEYLLEIGWGRRAKKWQAEQCFRERNRVGGGTVPVPVPACVPCCCMPVDPQPAGAAAAAWMNIVKDYDTTGISFAEEQSAQRNGIDGTA